MPQADFAVGPAEGFYFFKERIEDESQNQREKQNTAASIGVEHEVGDRVRKTDEHNANRQRDSAHHYEHGRKRLVHFIRLSFSTQKAHQG